MSGGSHDYLFSAAPDELQSLADRIEKMAAALSKAGFPVVAKRTADVADSLRAARAAALQLERLWHNQEWVDSGDWTRSSVRQEAVKLGEPLPPCSHLDKNHWLVNRGGALVRALVCEDCGEEWPDAELQAAIAQAVTQAATMGGVPDRAIVGGVEVRPDTMDSAPAMREWNEIVEGRAFGKKPRP